MGKTLSEALSSIPGISFDDTEETTDPEVETPLVEEAEAEAEVETEIESSQETEIQAEAESPNIESEKQTEATPSWISTYNLTEEEYTKQKEELETLRNRTNPLDVLAEDDFVKGYAKHVANGGDPKEYIQTQAKIVALDFEKMNPIDAVRQAHILQSIEDGFTEEEALEEWEDYKADRFDIYDEDSEKYQREIKKAFNKAKPVIEAHKHKLATPIGNPNQPQELTPEQVVANEKANKEFVAKYNKEQELEFKFKVGKEEVSLKDKGNLYKNAENQLKAGDFLADFRKEDGSVDEDKFLRTMYAAKNIDKLLALAHKQGATEFEANKLEQARNPKTKDTGSVPTSSTVINNRNAILEAFGKKKS